MDSSIVTDSIKDAWTRTRTLLFADRNVGRWLKYGFIAMLGATAVRGGGGGGFNVPSGPSGGGDGGEWGGSPGDIGPEFVDAFRAAVEWLGANIANLLVLLIGLVTIWLVLAVALMYVRAVFRFIFVDTVAAPREPAIGVSFHRHAGQGLSVLVWNILLGLIPLVLIVIALIPILGSMGLLMSGEPLGAVLGVGGMIGLIGLVLFAMLLMAIGRGLTDDFLVPAMYVRRCGVIEGWRHVFRAWRGEFGNVIFFYLLKIVLGIGAAIVTGLVGLASLILLVLPLATLGGIVGLIALSEMAPQTAVVIFGGPGLIAIVLGMSVFAYVVQVILLPVSVIFQSYSLAFVGRLDASLKTI
jgi:hypothetical protein